MQLVKELHCLLLASFLGLQPLAFAKDSKAAPKDQYNLQELALPSEVQGVNKATGSIYYSPSVKDKVLMPVHVWGQINKSGLHFVPLDTNIVKGLSLAGGPTASAKLSNIKLTRNQSGELKDYYFNLSDGGDAKAFETVLKPGDTIFIEKSTFREDRAYYTGLIGVVVTILSSILIIREIKRGQ